MTAKTAPGRKFRTVIFDMDGVIVDSERLYDLADAEVLRRRNIAFRRKEFVSKVMGKSFIESTKIFMDVFGISGEMKTIMDERRTVLLEKYATDLTFMEGFRDFYAALALKNISMCVATACEDKTLAMVDHKMGLTELFGENIFKLSDVGNKSKPDPAIFIYAAERMRAPRDTSVVIEDSPNGIRAAKNAGIACIGITTTHEPEDLAEADIVVGTFTDIDLRLFDGAPPKA